MNNQEARQAGTLQGIVLILPITLSTMGVAALAPILPQMIAHFGSVPGGAFMVQLILTVPALCLAVFSTPVGLLADRLGRRSLLMGAMLFYCITGVAPFFLDSLTEIFISRLGVGLAEAVIMVCSTAMIGDYFHGHAREKWLAYQTGIASFAAVVLFAASGALGAHFGWRGPFWIYSTSLILLVSLVLFTWEPRAEDQQHVIETAVSGSFPLRQIMLVCVVSVLAAVGFFIGQIELSVALVEKHFTDTAMIGTMSAGVSLAVTTGSVTFRYVASRWALPMQIIVSFLLMGAGLMLAGAAPSVPVLVAGITINLFGAGIALPTLLTWAMRCLTFAQRGRGTGMWMAAFEIGQFLSSLVATSLAALFGSMHAAFLVVGVVLALVGVGVMLRGVAVGERAEKTLV